MLGLERRRKDAEAEKGAKGTKAADVDEKYVALGTEACEKLGRMLGSLPLSHRSRRFEEWSLRSG